MKIILKDETIIGDKEAFDIFETMDNNQKAFTVAMAKARFAANLIEANTIKIRHVIFSGPATIVFWADGDKTVVKCMDGDTMNYEMGIALCTLKKLFGPSYIDFKKHMKYILEKAEIKEPAEKEKEEVNEEG